MDENNLSDEFVDAVAELVKAEYLNALSSGAGHIRSDLVADMVRHAMGKTHLTTTRHFAELRERDER